LRKKYAFVFINTAEENDPYFKAVSDKSRGIEADVRFLPTLNHLGLLGLCKEASLIVMNSRSDGTRVTAMEAMACKKPVILPPLPYDVEIFPADSIFNEWSPFFVERENRGNFRNGSLRTGGGQLFV
jgi:glycosyltransferase involved in cell wall biosynthesis